MQNWTGERLESFIQNENTLEHLHRYAMTAEYTSNKIVLDIASGEGYGSNILAENAKQVIGVDISETAIELAKNKYKKKNLEFRTGSTSLIPTNSNFFDVVVSFETIEHHDKHDEMMKEIKRVLKPDGVLIISTPDKLFYTDIPKTKNPFHVKELYLKEFEILIKKYFTNTIFFTQKCIVNSLIQPLDFSTKNSTPFKEYTGNYAKIETATNNEYLYIIAICSNNELVEINNNVSIFQSDKIAQQIKATIMDSVKNSIRYRLGSLVINPFAKIKQLLFK